MKTCIVSMQQHRDAKEAWKQFELTEGLTNTILEVFHDKVHFLNAIREPIHASRLAAIRTPLCEEINKFLGQFMSETAKIPGNSIAVYNALHLLVLNEAKAIKLADENRKEMATCVLTFIFSVSLKVKHLPFANIEDTLTEHFHLQPVNKA